jgi:hypothetical protein
MITSFQYQCHTHCIQCLHAVALENRSHLFCTICHRRILARALTFLDHQSISIHFIPIGHIGIHHFQTQLRETKFISRVLNPCSPPSLRAGCDLRPGRKSRQTQLLGRVLSARLPLEIALCTDILNHFPAESADPFAVSCARDEEFLRASVPVYSRAQTPVRRGRACVRRGRTCARRG